MKGPVQTSLDRRPAIVARPGWAAILFAAVLVGPGLPAAAAGNDDLARTLIDRFYEDLGPSSAELDAFMGEGFQIIGSDGLRFDKKSYLGFAKEVTTHEISDLVTRRDGDILTATYNVTYSGAFEGIAREVPGLARLAVFKETEPGTWKIEALAALGTGENDVAGIAPGVLAAWLAATASGDAGRIRTLAAPDFQIQRAQGHGATLSAFLDEGPEAGPAPAAVDISATSFSNTMVVRYALRPAGGAPSPRLTVFQRIGGKWLASAEARFPASGD